MMMMVMMVMMVMMMMMMIKNPTSWQTACMETFEMQQKSKLELGSGLDNTWLGVS